ncbi:Low temperature viability protein [Saccharata proteae CBS 121410]|uniref:Low temperature viability protein n=1 Tax=Saccharata proteae CBS 121410 TaxID=1314787 RepID=A0A9P4HVH5_9PEZI|nr:Low temperature viability protein [Saccharata proteae CBS 121410]
MAPRRKFDKNTAQHFKLVYRSQNDPRIHDPDAPDMVFAEVNAPNSRKDGANKIKSRHELEEEFGSGRLRENEGEAANYGIYYDDTEYDYMQHMRDLGKSSGAMWVPAEVEKEAKGKGKGKMKLEDALKGMGLDDEGSEAGISVSSSMSSAQDVFGEDLAPSEFVQKRTYQDQQDIPDALAGFQPDMDPRLREVLEALEDEAYVDDEDDIFAELAKGGNEVARDEWEDQDDFEDDDGWESDDTVKPEREFKNEAEASGGVQLPPEHAPIPETEDHGDGDWMAEFSKFKKDAKTAKAQKAAAPPSDLQSSLLTGTSSVTGGRKKKRKGALTSTSNYSMTSSSLFRTENQTLLDDRFDKLEEEYADDGFGDDVSVGTGMSGLSVYSSASQSGAVRQDFDSILDEFSLGYASSGKRGTKKNGYKEGLAQLDAVRKGLGPARVRS